MMPVRNRPEARLDVRRQIAAVGSGVDGADLEQSVIILRFRGSSTSLEAIEDKDIHRRGRAG